MVYGKEPKKGPWNQGMVYLMLTPKMIESNFHIMHYPNAWFLETISLINSSLLNTESEA